MISSFDSIQVHEPPSLQQCDSMEWVREWLDGVVHDDTTRFSLAWIDVMIVVQIQWSIFIMCVVFEKQDPTPFESNERAPLPLESIGITILCESEEEKNPPTNKYDDLINSLAGVECRQ